MHRPAARAYHSFPLLLTILTSCGGAADVVAPRVPAALQMVSGSGQSAAAGSALAAPVVLQVLDGDGQPLAGTRVAFQASVGSGTVSPDTALTTTSGEARTQWTLGRTAGPQTLHATVEGYPALTVIVSSSAIAGTVARLAKEAGDLQMVLAGELVPIAPAIRVLDAFGNPVSGATVQFSVGSGSGTVTGATVVSSVSGLATVGSWQLGAGTGPFTLTASVAGASAVTFTATVPALSLRALTPARGALVGDQATAGITVMSVYEVASVTVAVNGVSTALQPSPGGRWQGPVSLAAAPHDSVSFDFTVTDVRGTSAFATTTALHDTPPAIAIAAPDENAATDGTVRVAATCTDDATTGCASLTVTAVGTIAGAQSSVVVLSGTTSVAGGVSIAQFEWDKVMLVITARDSRNQTVTATRTVLLPGTANLRRVATVPPGAALDTVRDYRPGLVLGSRSSGQLVTYEPSSGAVTTVDSVCSIGRPYVAARFTTPGLLAASSKCTATNLNDLREYRSGVLTATTTVMGVMASELFAAYTDLSGVLYRRDLQTGATVDLSGAVGSPQSWTVASNGDVAFVVRGNAGYYRSYWYHRGSLVAADTATSIRAVTDGVNLLVYAVEQQPDALPIDRLVLHGDGTTDTLATAAETQFASSGLTYAVAGGWTAFTRPGPSGVLQVWLRSPSGVLTQVTQGASGSTVEAVAPDGTAVFQGGGRRYVGAATGATTDISAGSTGAGPNGQVILRDGILYLVRGLSVYQIAR